MGSRAMTLTLLALLLAAAAVPAAETPAASAPVTLTSIRAGLAGAWTGKLEYRDYQADRWFGLPVTVRVEMMRDGLTLIRRADFDDGPKTGIVTITTAALFDPATNREQSVSLRKGREAELITTTLRLTRADAADRWTIEEVRDGRDDDRPARIRETTRRDGATMVTVKEVDFLDDTGETWLVRNRTSLTRQ
ncbi:MAG: hypothetical protein C0476_04190 [Sphingomonas sp.]|nr:hypothetical protein [Sphingomonas sp.]